MKPFLTSLLCEFHFRSFHFSFISAKKGPISKGKACWAKKTFTQEVQADQIFCPLVIGNPLYTWIVPKTGHFVWPWTSLVYSISPPTLLVFSGFHGVFSAPALGGRYGGLTNGIQRRTCWPFQLLTEMDAAEIGGTPMSPADFGYRKFFR